MLPKWEILVTNWVPNWRMIEKRHLRLENQTKTWLSSCQELVFVCGYPLMCPTPVVSLHFLREIWLKSQFDRFRGFVLPTHFQEQVGWGNWLVFVCPTTTHLYLSQSGHVIHLLKQIWKTEKEKKQDVGLTTTSRSSSATWQPCRPPATTHFFTAGSTMHSGFCYILLP